MNEEKKEIKKTQAYTLSPSKIAWLRQRAMQESSPEKTVSASAVLERIIDEAMVRNAKQLALPIPQPKEKKRSSSLEAVAA